MNFIERHFREIALFTLLLVMMSAHAFMIHAGRPPQMVEWVETLISSVMAALIAILARDTKP